MKKLFACWEGLPCKDEYYYNKEGYHTACVESLGILCESLSSVLIQAGWTASSTNYAPVDSRTIGLFQIHMNNGLKLYSTSILHGGRVAAGFALSIGQRKWECRPM